jgi:hypothetical protein
LTSQGLDFAGVVSVGACGGMPRETRRPPDAVASDGRGRARSWSTAAQGRGAEGRAGPRSRASLRPDPFPGAKGRAGPTPRRPASRRGRGVPGDDLAAREAVSGPKAAVRAGSIPGAAPRSPSTPDARRVARRRRSVSGPFQLARVGETGDALARGCCSWPRPRGPRWARLGDTGDASAQGAAPVLARRGALARGVDPPGARPVCRFACSARPLGEGRSSSSAAARAGRRGGGPRARPGARGRSTAWARPTATRAALTGLIPARIVGSRR